MDVTSFATFLQKSANTKIKRQDRYFNYLFPVTKINEMPCKVIISIYDKKSITLKIEECNINLDFRDMSSDSEITYFGEVLVSHKGCGEAILEMEDYINALKKIHVILPLLKFNKYLGEFDIQGKENESQQEIEFLKVFLKNDNIKTCIEDCSVCYEATKTKTNCGHHLCYLCWENLPLVKNEDEDDGEVHFRFNQSCPICRAEIYATP